MISALVQAPSPSLTTSTLTGRRLAGLVGRVATVAVAERAGVAFFVVFFAGALFVAAAFAAPSWPGPSSRRPS